MRRTASSSLKRPSPCPGRRALDLRWSPEQSQAVVEAILAVHRSMTEATGGRLMPNAAWRLFKSLVTLHPLGGCKMGVTPKRESSITSGRCLAIRTCYVVDGSILPTSDRPQPVAHDCRPGRTHRRACRLIAITLTAKTSRQTARSPDARPGAACTTETTARRS